MAGRGQVGVRAGFPSICLVFLAHAAPSDRLTDLSSPSLEVREAAARDLSLELSRLEAAGDRAGLRRLMEALRRVAGEQNPDLGAREEAEKVLFPFQAGFPVWQKKAQDLPGVPVCLAEVTGRIAAGGLAYPEDPDDDERGWVGVYDRATGKTVWETGSKGLGWPVSDIALSGGSVFAAGENDEGAACIARLDAATGKVTARARIKRAQVWNLNPLPEGGVLAIGMLHTDPDEGKWESWVCVLDAAGEKVWEKGFEPAAIGSVHVRDGRFWLGGRSGDGGWLCAAAASRIPESSDFKKLPFQAGAACPVGSCIAVSGTDKEGVWIHLFDSRGTPRWRGKIGDPGETVLGMKETRHGVLAWGWNGRTDPKWMWGWGLDIGMSSWVGLYDAGTGKRLWRQEGLRDFPGCTARDIPVTERGILVLTRADATGGERLLAIDPATGKTRLDRTLRFPGKADAFLADPDGGCFYAAGVIVAPDEDGDLDDELGAGGWLGAYRVADADAE